VASSYRYDAFGNTISSSGTLASANLYRFSSKEVDPNYTDSGLYYYGYRWYDPNLQRWLNRDPISERLFKILSRRPVRNVSDGRNLYIFVDNNAVGKIDPLGLTIWYNPSNGSYYNDANGQIWWSADPVATQRWIDDQNTKSAGFWGKLLLMLFCVFGGDPEHPGSKPLNPQFGDDKKPKLERTEPPMSNPTTNSPPIITPTGPYGW